MKKFISIFLVCFLAFSIVSCAKESVEDVSKTTQPYSVVTKEEETQAETSSPDVKTKNISISAPVMETQNWQEYSFSEYNGKEEYTISLDIPEAYTYDATIIYNEENTKYGEVVGIVPYTENQSAFDNVELNKAYGDITYTDKKDGELENGRNYTLLIGSAPIESGTWNVYSYLVDFQDYGVKITMYSVNDYDQMSQEYVAIINSITVE